MRFRKSGYARCSPGEDAVDVRIISATHQNLKELVAQGKFRQDLFYRLNVLELRMPSLRECREDIPLLAQRFIGQLAQSAGVAAPNLTPAAQRALGEYPFPGNVRELENIIERAMALLSGNTIDVADLNLTPAVAATSKQLPLQDYLDQTEKQAILEALNKTRNNRTAAAKLLGVTFRSLRYRMERLGLNE